MNEGAFALLDCLGFRGIWQREGVRSDPSQLVEFLEDAMAHAEQLAVRRMAANMLPGKVEITTAFVSDSVAVSACSSISRKLTDAERGYLVLLTTIACMEVTKRFLQARTPLLLRGCVSYGEHIVRKNFFLGPAVDEAASMAESSQGAFVWLTPCCASFYSQYIDHFTKRTPIEFNQLAPEAKVRAVEGMINAMAFFNTDEVNRKFQDAWSAVTTENRALIADALFQFIVTSEDGILLLKDYPVPLRTGGELRAMVLNPLCMIPFNEQLNTLNAADATFNSSKLDVMLKRQYTLQLLRASMKATFLHQEAYKRRSAELRVMAGQLGFTIP